MGNWVIHIEGTGPHQNGLTYDADAIFADTIDALRQATQTLTAASFTVGGTYTEDQVRRLYIAKVQERT